MPDGRRLDGGRAVVMHEVGRFGLRLDESLPAGQLIDARDTAANPPTVTDIGGGSGGRR